MGLAIIFTSVLLHAQDPVSLRIERAQELALKKKRVEAATELRRELTNTTSTANRARLREALRFVARVFVSDKGQRAFETGQSFGTESPDVAIARLREALTSECENTAVQLALAKIYLFKQQCRLARTEVDAARTLDPEDGKAAVLELRTLICEEDYVRMRKVALDLPILTKWQATFVIYLQALAQLQQGQRQRAGEGFARVVVDAPRFPEAHYHAARAETSARRSEDELRKYVGLCKTLGVRERREFALEPRVCANQKEAEDELANKSTNL